MEKIINIIRIIIEIMIVFYVLLITIFMLSRNHFGYSELFGYQFHVIQDNNKDIVSKGEVGDLLIIKKDKTIKVGDTIYYYGIVDNRYVAFSGKVQEIKDKQIYQIEGDPTISVLAERVIGTETKKISKLGIILEFLESRFGFLFFVLLPIMVVFIYHIFQLFVYIRYDEVK